MVQLRILSGARKGTAHVIREFPCIIGRAANVQLRLEEPGVWDQHLRVDLKSEEGFALQVQPSALANLNGAPCRDARLRNGDVIELGSVKLQFWLSEVAQASLKGREYGTWLMLAAIMLAQMGLIYWLTR